MTELGTPRIWPEGFGTPGKAYRPSNGTEGRSFEGYFCSGCLYDHEAHMGRLENGCDIFARALAFRLEDEWYPSEWVIADDGYPTCTAFTPDGCS